MPISKKTKWVSTSAWRGYTQPINAVAGANDTGSWPDSPCPTNIALAELEMVKERLRDAGIRFIEMITPSSNVFCQHRYILTDSRCRKRAADIAKELQDETRLLYAVYD